jgi:phage gp29-like protein
MNPFQIETLTSQIATRANSAQFFSALGMMLPNPDTVLRAIGRDITVYRELRADPQIGGNIKRRKGAVQAMEWGVDDGRAKKGSAQFVLDIFADMEMDNIFSEILDTPLYGYQPLEVMWVNVGSKIVPGQIIGKPPEWFLFDTENQFRLRTRSNPVYGEIVSERKFLLPRQDATYDNPYGLSDLSMCFWPTTFKKGGLKFWVTFAEKYGMPWVIGKHPRNTKADETDELLQQLSDMIQDAVAVIPDDSSIEIIEAGGKGASADVYEQLLMFCRSEVNYAMLGQNQTSEASSNRASAQAGLEVTKDIRDADAKIVTKTMNLLIKWIWELNSNDSEQKEVDEVRAKRDKTLTDAGVKFSSSYFKRAYGLQEGDIVETLTPAVNAVAFSESSDAFPDQDALDAALIALADNQMQDQVSTILKPLVQLINDSADYPEAMGKLAALFPKLDTASLEETLTRAMFVSELWGYANGND